MRERRDAIAHAILAIGPSAVKGKERERERQEEAPGSQPAGRLPVARAGRGAGPTGGRAGESVGTSQDL